MSETITLDGIETVTLENAETGEVIVLSLEDFLRDCKVIRKRDYIPNLFGATKKETVSKMLEDIENNTYYDFADRDCNDKIRVFWHIDKSISGFDLGKLPLRLRVILATWNQYPFQKQLTILSEELHLEYLSEELDLEDGFYGISKEEKMTLLKLMIDYEVYNSNGFKLDGSNIHDLEGYPPQYESPY